MLIDKPNSKTDKLTFPQVIGIRNKWSYKKQRGKRKEKFSRFSVFEQKSGDKTFPYQVISFMNKKMSKFSPTDVVCLPGEFKLRIIHSYICMNKDMRTK